MTISIWVIKLPLSILGDFPLPLSSHHRHFACALLPSLANPPQLRKYFGIYALITAALLIIPQTSKKAMRLAFGFTVLSLYSAWVNGWPMMAQFMVLGAEMVGLLTS